MSAERRQQLQLDAEVNAAIMYSSLVLTSVLGLTAAVAYYAAATPNLFFSEID